MKLKILAAVISGILVAGCGGGDGDDTTASTNTSGSSGTTQTGSDNGTGTSGASGDGTVASGSDVQYLNETAQASQSQAQQSQTVAQRSSNPEVQALAQQLTTEVSIINQQITQVSQNNNVTINNNVTTQQQTQINTINNLSGAELDRAYVEGLVDTWRNLLASTLAQARQGTDVDIRQTASANALVVEQRLVAAEELLVILQPMQYLIDAYQSGLLEIQLGQVALQNATDARVRQFAQHMIDDHTQINSRLAAVAQQKGTALPSGLSPEKQEILAMISAFSGDDFDKAFMDRNVLLHAELVSKTTVVSQRSPDAEIQALASESLPSLQEHLQSAQSIATSLQGSQYYQLGQNLITGIQIAQLAQVHSTDTQIRTLAQQIVAENQATYAQLIQLAQQRNEPVPLTIPPGQVQAVLQLLRTSGTDVNTQLLNLIRAQTNQGLQIAQSAQSSSDAGISGLAAARVSALQSIDARVTQTESGGGNTDAGNGGSAGTGTSTQPSAGNGAGSSDAAAGGAGADATGAGGTDGSTGTSGSAGTGADSTATATATTTG